MSTTIFPIPRKVFLQLEKYYSNPDEIWVMGVENFLKQNPDKQHLVVEFVSEQINKNILFKLGKSKGQTYSYFQKVAVSKSEDEIKETAKQQKADKTKETRKNLKIMYNRVNWDISNSDKDLTEDDLVSFAEIENELDFEHWGRDRKRNIGSAIALLTALSQGAEQGDYTTGDNKFRSQETIERYTSYLSNFNAVDGHFTNLYNLHIPYLRKLNEEIINGLY